MDRAAADPRRQAAIAGLLTALAIACATVQQPPGGPPDPDPPVLLRVTPDSGVAMEGFDDEVIFEFDEVIAEAGIEDLFTVSPRHLEVRVSWKRQRIGIKPRDGWQDSVPYRITLAPGVTDLRQNRTTEGYQASFTTGGAPPTTVITGNTVDWENSRIVTQALIEAIRVRDSLTFIGASDSLGQFVLEGVPPGRYLLSGAIDQNNNRLRERRESFDTVTVTLDSSLTQDFWMFVRDTVGPRLQTLNAVDSLAVALDYNQALALELPTIGDANVRLLPDSVFVPVSGFLWRAAFDSLRAADRAQQAAIADSLRADSIAAAADSVGVDSLAVAGDTVTLGRPPAPGQPPVGAAPPGAPTPPPEAEPQESNPERERQLALLGQRPQLRRSLVLLMAEPLVPGGRYVVETTVRNPLGLAETSIRVLTVAAPDSTAHD